MKLQLSLVVLVLLGAMAGPTAAKQSDPACHSDSGIVITDEIDSVALRQTRSYNLYLPPNWCELTDLPLLIMLHGYGGNYTDWVDDGHIDEVADELILAGEIEPIIILMPDGDDSYYISGEYGDYEPYIVFELINEVDSQYPTAATGESRSIGGYSMGGFGAMYLALLYPDKFSAVGGHSAAVFTSSSEPPPWVYGPGGEFWDQRNPVSIIERNGWPPHIRLFLDMGIDDRLMTSLYYVLTAFDHQPGVEFEAHVWPGNHNWDYWGAHVADYLRFYAGT
jgi:enterochelin esterase-like enzyme